MMATMLIASTQMRNKHQIPSKLHADMVTTDAHDMF